MALVLSLDLCEPDWLGGLGERTNPENGVLESSHLALPLGLSNSSFAPLEDEGSGNPLDDRPCHTSTLPLHIDVASANNGNCDRLAPLGAPVALGAGGIGPPAQGQLAHHLGASTLAWTSPRGWRGGSDPSVGMRRNRSSHPREVCRAGGVAARPRGEVVGEAVAAVRPRPPVVRFAEEERTKEDEQTEQN